MLRGQVDLLETDIAISSDCSADPTTVVVAVDVGDHRGPRRSVLTVSASRMGPALRVLDRHYDFGFAVAVVEADFPARPTVVQLDAFEHPLIKAGTDGDDVRIVSAAAIGLVDDHFTPGRNRRLAPASLSRQREGRRQSQKHNDSYDDFDHC